MAIIQVHNPEPSAVVYTSQGRVLAGHATGPGDNADAVTTRLLAAGRLIRINKPQPRAKVRTAKSRKVVALKPKEDTQK